MRWLMTAYFEDSGEQILGLYLDEEPTQGDIEDWIAVHDLDKPGITVKVEEVER